MPANKDDVIFININSLKDEKNKFIRVSNFKTGSKRKIKHKRGKLH